MKKIGLTIMMLGIALMTGCASNIGSPKVTDVNEATRVIAETKQLEVWCHYGGWESIGEAFEALNPGVEVTFKEFGYNDYVEAYLEALATGEVPDVMIIDSTHMGQFNTLDVFEDLAQPPYTASEYKDDFDGELWNAGFDFNGQKLIALPFATAPLVTYYRSDIMEEYGFPSEPEALGDYIANVDNWINMGKKLAKDGIYITQWVADPVSIVGKSQGYFDKDFNFLRDNDKFKEAIDIACRIKEEDIVPLVGIWEDKGQEMLKNDQFAMLYLGSWGARDIASWVPEQSGKWRVTRLPFDVYGWNNSTMMSIPERSVNKELAWEFIEYYTFYRDVGNTVGNVGSYKPMRNNPKALAIANPFLGGQKSQEVYERVLAQTEEYMLTPLDQQAEDIINTLLNQGIERGYNAERIIDDIITRIDDMVEQEKLLLLPTEE